MAVLPDFAEPVPSSQRDDILEYIRDNIEVLSKMDYTGASNIPTGALRVSQTNRAIEKYNGSGWDTLFTFDQAGDMKMTGKATAPTGWLMCNGSAISRTGYADLFTAISTNYGVGDGSTTFNLPDLRQRFPLGQAASGTGATLGETGGEIGHTHTCAAHDHIVKDHYHGPGTLHINTGSGDHQHNIGHTHSSVQTIVDGPHNHYLQMRELPNANFGLWYNVPTAYYGGEPLIQQSGTYKYTATDGQHQHSIGNITLAATNTSSSEGDHGHSNGYFDGSVGDTGGENGDADFLSGPASYDVSSDSGANNPPFQTVNFIIKT